MIVQSEDRSRTAVETVVYALLITSVVVSIVAAAVQAVTLPGRVSVNQTNTEYRA
jgi:multisubunit Na+/H+ antiporter MnhC subunit